MMRVVLAGIWGATADGLARHDDEAAVVLLLVGELLGQHVQT